MRSLGAAALALAGAIGAYASHRALEMENERLAGIVHAKLGQVGLPAGSRFVYEEVEVSRDCKTATLTRLFASDASPASICEALSLSLAQGGWKLPSGCRSVTYPLFRAPAHGGRPEYSYSVMDARSPEMFGVNVSAQPREAWGHFFMLSAFGEREAIPLARKAGESFFTVSLSYAEDLDLHRRLCPPERLQCECNHSSRHERRFAALPSP
jgi:hypothetical protein